MRIGVVSSMHHSERMLETVNKLRELGHNPFCSSFVNEFIGHSDEEKEIIKLHQKYHRDAIRDFWSKMQGADAILVLNLERHGIVNYIGGNTLIEIGFAHILNQKIFLYNPIPDMPYCKTEIVAVKPIIINGDLTLIR